MATRVLLSELRIIQQRMSDVIACLYERELALNPDFEGDDELIEELARVRDQLGRQIAVVDAMDGDDRSRLFFETLE